MRASAMVDTMASSANATDIVCASPDMELGDTKLHAGTVMKRTESTNIYAPDAHESIRVDDVRPPTEVGALTQRVSGIKQDVTTVSTEAGLTVPPAECSTCATVMAEGTSISGKQEADNGRQITDDDESKVLQEGPANFFSHKYESSAERNIWSVFNPIWSARPGVKFRLPKPSDEGADWAGTVGVVDELKHFRGLNNSVNRATVGFFHRCIQEKLVMGSAVIGGPAGSGKTAVVKVFLDEFLRGFASNPQALARRYRTRVLNITPQELIAPTKKLTKRVTSFLSAKEDRLSSIVPRFIVVDGMETVSSKSQQSLMSMIDAAKAGSLSGGGSGATKGAAGAVAAPAGVRMLLTTRAPLKLVESLRKVVKPYKLELVEEIDGVRICLRILRLENVGYELLGIKAIFRKHWPDLKLCIATATKVFCEKQYLSEINTLKVIAPRQLAEMKEKARHVKAWASLYPLDRCKACTLRPPCDHITEQDLARLGLQRRGELPQRSTESKKASSGTGREIQEAGIAQGYIDCQDFIKTGSCRSFNSLGRCNNHHPLDLHVVDILQPRCPQCTLRLPCGHCDYNKSRERLRVFCELAGAQAKKRIARFQRVASRGTGPWKAQNTSPTIEATRYFHAEPGATDIPDDGGAIHLESPTGGNSASREEGQRSTLTVFAALSANGGQAPSLRLNRSRPEETASTLRTDHPSRSTSDLRAGFESFIARFEALDEYITSETTWISSKSADGGMSEFRASVFDKKFELLSSRCHKVHAEADTLTDELRSLDEGAGDIV